MDNFNAVGRLTRDFEVRTINNNGKTFYVSTSAIAIQREYKNKEGKYDVDFIDIQMWGEGFATKMTQYLKKGNMVHVTGRLETNKYVAKDGSNRMSFKINCSGVRNLTFNRPNDNNQQNQSFTPTFNESNNYGNSNMQMAPSFDANDFSPLDGDEDIPF